MVHTKTSLKPSGLYFLGFGLTPADSFYFVIYGLSIITSNSLSNKNINTGVSRDIVVQKGF